MISVEQIASRDVAFESEETTARQMARKMHETGLGFVVVVTDEERPIGVLSDRDLTTRVIAAERDPDTTLLGEIMSAQPLTVAGSTPVESALDLMNDHDVRQLVVLDDQGQVTGVVTLDGILDLLAGE